jgi:hypothetical protein
MAEADSKSEAGRVPRLDDSEMYWHEATSKNGAKYHIGVLKSDYPDLSEQEVKDLFATKQGGKNTKPEIVHTTGDQPISWPCTGNDDSWKVPAQRIKDLFDIKKYCVCNNFFSIWFDYKLWINIDQDWTYDFYDETGDYYRIYTYRTGTHSVAYNSKKPTIVKIIAWS